MSQELTDLTAQVEASVTVEESAITLINGIAAQIAAAGVDQAKLTTLHDELQASADALSMAVVTNTPPPVGPTGV